MAYSPTGVYLFEVNNGNAKTLLEVYSKLTKRKQNDAIDVVITLRLLVV